MKKIVLLAMLLLAGQISVAQNAKKIIGKWAYVDIQDDSGDMDEQSKQMVGMLFKDLTISFAPDNTMTLNMRKKPEGGKYAFDKTNENLITATSASGKEMHLTIVKLTDSELTLTLDKAGTLKLKRASDTPDIAAPIPDTPKVPATQKQIVGKWYIVGTTDKEMSPMASEIMKGSYVNFGADGKYDAKALSVEQKGKWTFGEGNTTIVVDMGEEGKWVWSIYKISNTELVMQNDTSSKRMIFSRAQK